MSPPSRNQLTKVPNPRPPRPHSFSCIGSSAGRHRAEAKPMKVTSRNEATTMMNVTAFTWLTCRHLRHARPAGPAGLVLSSR